MNTRPLFLLLICFMLSTPSLHAQDPAIDTIVAELYESISFSPEQNPDYETFRSLFAEGSRLIKVNDTSSATITPQEYQQVMTRQREEGDIIAFKEYELHRKTEQYGPILHLFSTYQTELKTANGNKTARGINSIQLMKKDGKWKVVSLIWHEEDKAHPLPQQYLPGNSR